MGSRGKLNAAYTFVALVFAAWFGAALNSWWGFAVVLAVALGLLAQGGHIRLRDARRRVA